MTTGTTGTADEAPLFGPESQFSAFFDDPRWALAMVRATVLEAAHPQIGAALVDNSTFVAHPWRRLRNTFLSMRRMFGTDSAVREREAARLNRLHARMSGSDSRGRAYDAMDRATRAWVVATLFESAVTMCRLSGQPLDQDTMERMYAEYRTFLAALDGDAAELPKNLNDFWRYFDRVVENELENTEAARVILYRLFDHLTRPSTARRRADAVGGRPGRRRPTPRRDHRRLAPRAIPAQGRAAGDARCPDPHAGRLPRRRARPLPARRLDQRRKHHRSPLTLTWQRRPPRPDRDRPARPHE
ncbi:oxygenase MpaB family protein [Streptomyces sp. NPDC059340]|uniref:oxygenase MpaB family protein n=1 Tax=Streptomyces sp. NPDC059340 TaxID=3346806 RepID=UPI0036A1E977